MQAAHGMPFGAQIEDGGVRFRLWAPDLEAVELVLPETGRTLGMGRREDGWFELTTAEAGPGTAYRYRLPDGLEVPDPASRFQPRGPHEPSRVVDPGAYAWRDEGWRGRPWGEAVIYELHVGTFTAEGTYGAAATKLAHLVELGVTAVQLMPLAQFQGARGWGYDGVLPYAPHSAYGEPHDLKAFVDTAHGAGLMVFLDVVYNHFGPDGNYLPLYASRMFDETKPTPWGAAIAWQEHPVRDFAIHNVLYWLEEYRIDGLRFDAVHALIDDSPTHILEEIGRAVRAGPGQDRPIHLVLENDDNSARLLAPQGPYDGQWNDDWHHCAHVLLTGEGDGYYRPYKEDTAGKLRRAVAQGFVWQGEPSPNHDNEPRGEPTTGTLPTAFVDCLQNHDQIGNRALGERLTSLASPQALEVFTALLLLSPHTPMLFQGEEWGATTPFLFFTDYKGDLADAVREGRRREMARFPAFADPANRERIPDPNARQTFDASTLDWDEPGQPAHAARLAFVRRLLRLRRELIAPRLAGIAPGPGTAEPVGDAAIRASWTLGDGSRLVLLANLGDRTAEIGAAAGEPFLTWPEAAGASPDRLPAWSITATLEPAGGGQAVAGAAPVSTPGAAPDAGEGGGAAGIGPAPVATYRLQIRDGIDFKKATELVPYLARLGVSHLYASPLTRAGTGSSHGYDVADFTELDPALGSEAGFTALSDALRGHEMGLLLDIVPNHMGVGPDNPWWWDVLENGRDSAHADVFDIDWDVLGGRVLLPVLGSPYGEVLEKGELRLVQDESATRPAVAYYDNRFPLHPDSLSLIDESLPDLLRQEPLPRQRIQGLLAEASTPERLHPVLEAQAYRLAHWRAGDWMLNYRRFFTITELAGVRVEDERVFDATHALVLRLVREGRLHGVRIDHIDGLADPKAYLERLQAALAAALAGREGAGREGGEDATGGGATAGADIGALAAPTDPGNGGRPGAPADGVAAPPPGTERPFWVLIEKILGPDEELPADWATAGTSGYEFLNLVLGLLLDEAGLARLEALYRERTGAGPFAPVVIETKRLVLGRLLVAEVDRLTREAKALLATDLATRDLPIAALREAMQALVVGFDVYRTYVDAAGIGEADRRRLDAALARARDLAGIEDPAVFETLARLARAEVEGSLPFARRLQQLSGPVMAKALEDTAFYRWHRLDAANEVGGEPEHPVASPLRFHADAIRRRAGSPLALLATATHDTKRGEDLRARLAVLAELPDLWDEATARWLAYERESGVVADDLWLFWQTLLGAWPLDLAPGDQDQLHLLADRLVAYMMKAMREAKLRTGWTAPDQPYEAAVEQLIRRRLDPTQSAAFLGEVEGVVARLAPAGAMNGLAQLLLKLTAPGVPDLYQGTEFWDLSLVDPDNRRPVDWAARAEALDAGADLPLLLETWRDGRVKAGLLATTLALRRQHPPLFTEGPYEPLHLDGEHKEHGLAFMRGHGHEEHAAGAPAVITLVALRVAHLLGTSDTPLVPADAWGDTGLVLPAGLAHARWRCLLNGTTHRAEYGRIPLRELLTRFPMALLVAG